MSENDPILVAVDGSEGSLAALRYAAHEADRRGADLRILHVAPDYLPVAGLYPMPPTLSPAEFEATGKTLLAEAQGIAHDLIDDDRVSVVLATGDRVRGILDAAVHARLVVLGDDRTPLLQRVAVGSAVANVAARAEVPVVTVPADWAHRPTAHRIVAAIKQYDAAPLGLIRAALERAAAEDAALRIVHVWNFPQAYGDLILPMIDLDGWTRMVEHRLRADAADLLAAHQDVSVEVVARYGHPATVLRDVSADADLLVIARRTRLPDGTLRQHRPRPPAGEPLPGRGAAARRDRHRREPRRLAHLRSHLRPRDDQ